MANSLTKEDLANITYDRIVENARSIGVNTQVNVTPAPTSTNLFDGGRPKKVTQLLADEFAKNNITDPESKRSILSALSRDYPSLLKDVDLTPHLGTPTVESAPSLPLQPIPHRNFSSSKDVPTDDAVNNVSKFIASKRVFPPSPEQLADRVEREVRLTNTKGFRVKTTAEKVYDAYPELKKAVNKAPETVVSSIPIENIPSQDKNQAINEAVNILSPRRIATANIDGQDRTIGGPGANKAIGGTRGAPILALRDLRDSGEILGPTAVCFEQSFGKEPKEPKKQFVVIGAFIPDDTINSTSGDSGNNSGGSGNASGNFYGHIYAIPNGLSGLEKEDFIDEKVSKLGLGGRWKTRTKPERQKGEEGEHKGTFEYAPLPDQHPLLLEAERIKQEEVETRAAQPHKDRNYATDYLSETATAALAVHAAVTWAPRAPGGLDASISNVAVEKGVKILSSRPQLSAAPIAIIPHHKFADRTQTVGGPGNGIPTLDLRRPIPTADGGSEVLTEPSLVLHLVPRNSRNKDAYILVGYLFPPTQPGAQPTELDGNFYGQAIPVPMNPELSQDENIRLAVERVAEDLGMPLNRTLNGGDARYDVKNHTLPTFIAPANPDDARDFAEASHAAALAVQEKAKAGGVNFKTPNDGYTPIDHLLGRTDAKAIDTPVSRPVDSPPPPPPKRSAPSMEKLAQIIIKDLENFDPAQRQQRLNDIIETRNLNAVQQQQLAEAIYNAQNNRTTPYELTIGGQSISDRAAFAIARDGDEGRRFVAGLNAILEKAQQKGEDRQAAFDRYIENNRRFVENNDLTTMVQELHQGNPQLLQGIRYATAAAVIDDIGAFLDSSEPQKEQERVLTDNPNVAPFTNVSPPSLTSLIFENDTQLRNPQEALNAILMIPDPVERGNALVHLLECHTRNAYLFDGANPQALTNALAEAYERNRDGITQAVMPDGTPAVEFIQRALGQGGYIPQSVSDPLDAIFQDASSRTPEETLQQIMTQTDGKLAGRALARFADEYEDQAEARDIALATALGDHKNLTFFQQAIMPSGGNALQAFRQNFQDGETAKKRNEAQRQQEPPPPHTDPASPEEAINAALQIKNQPQRAEALFAERERCLNGGDPALAAQYRRAMAVIFTAGTPAAEWLNHPDTPFVMPRGGNIDLLNDDIAQGQQLLAADTQARAEQTPEADNIQPAQDNPTPNLPPVSMHAHQFAMLAEAAAGRDVAGENPLSRIARVIVRPASPFKVAQEHDVNFRDVIRTDQRLNHPDQARANLERLNFSGKPLSIGSFTSLAEVANDVTDPVEIQGLGEARVEVKNISYRRSLRHPSAGAVNLNPLSDDPIDVGQLKPGSVERIVRQRDALGKACEEAGVSMDKLTERLHTGNSTVQLRDAAALVELGQGKEEIGDAKIVIDDVRHRNFGIGNRHIGFIRMPHIPLLDKAPLIKPLFQRAEVDFNPYHDANPAKAVLRDMTEKSRTAISKNYDKLLLLYEGAGPDDRKLDDVLDFSEGRGTITLSRAERLNYEAAIKRYEDALVKQEVAAQFPDRNAPPTAEQLADIQKNIHETKGQPKLDMIARHDVKPVVIHSTKTAVEFALQLGNDPNIFRFKDLRQINVTEMVDELAKLATTTPDPRNQNAVARQQRAVAALENLDLRDTTLNGAQVDSIQAAIIKHGTDRRHPIAINVDLGDSTVKQANLFHPERAVAGMVNNAGRTLEGATSAVSDPIKDTLGRKLQNLGHGLRGNRDKIVEKPNEEPQIGEIKVDGHDSPKTRKAANNVEKAKEKALQATRHMSTQISGGDDNTIPGAPTSTGKSQQTQQNRRQ
ncbi:MAG: hypothetical protein J0L97_03740 [Alphaproteobacteria bacterium]|nr:hypothetical protein [Alphaproteobacteria bacterium]